MTTTTRPPARRRLSLDYRKTEKAAEVVVRKGRAPAKQREGGWGQYQWLAWQDKLFPGLSPTQRQPLVSRICGIKSAMYYKLNGGAQFASERVQRICELAELAMRVAHGEETGADILAAKRLLEGREASLIQTAIRVLNGKLTPEDRKLAANAVLLSDIQRIQRYAETKPADAP